MYRLRVCVSESPIGFFFLLRRIMSSNYGMSKEDYEDYYGEKVVLCRTHNITAIDSCPACEEEEWSEEDDSE